VVTDQRTYYIRRTRLGRTGWTRVRGSAQAAREVAAWRSAGWTVDEPVPSNPVIRAEVKAWERKAKGYPGSMK